MHAVPHLSGGHRNWEDQPQQTSENRQRSITKRHGKHLATSCETKYDSSRNTCRFSSSSSDAIESRRVKMFSQLRPKSVARGVMLEH